MLVHFDSMLTLRNFVQSAHFSPDDDAISTKIVVAPDVDRAYLDWKKVMRNPTYFPGDPAVNEDIIEYVQKALTAAKVTPIYSEICKVWTGRGVIVSSDSKKKATVSNTIKHQLGAMTAALATSAPNEQSNPASAPSPATLESASQTNSGLQADIAAPATSKPNEQSKPALAPSPVALESALQTDSGLQADIATVTEQNSEIAATIKSLKDALISWRNAEIYSETNKGIWHPKRWAAYALRLTQHGSSQKQIAKLESTILTDIQKLGTLLEKEHNIGNYGSVANVLPVFVKGALHCEAYLASILDPSVRGHLSQDQNFTDILAETEVGYYPILLTNYLIPIFCRNRATNTL